MLRGRYEIDRELGRGGYSVVYLARDRELDTDVALKLLVPPPAAAKVARERMRREVQAVRGLSHANIVAVFDFLEEGPVELHRDGVRPRPRPAGSGGRPRAARRGHRRRDSAATWRRRSAAAHRRGILHRDVKPQNILLDPDGRARLTDFGSAKLDGQLGVTGSGTLAGTLAYTAPEVLAGRRGDARADVYALGLTLYYALTGDLPERSSPHLPPTPAPKDFARGACAPAAPAWLDDVVAHATPAAAEDRFPTAASLDEALARPGAASALLMDGGGTCLLCAGPDPLALGLCPACGGSTDAADTLVFLRREATRLGSSRGRAPSRGGAARAGARRDARGRVRRAAGLPGAEGRRDAPGAGARAARAGCTGGSRHARVERAAGQGVGHGRRGGDRGRDRGSGGDAVSALDQSDRRDRSC